jgi:hypothetical protein
VPAYPDLVLFPEVIVGRDGWTYRRRAIDRAPCVKCGGSTIVAYSDVGTPWPTCRVCAKQAAGMD